MKFHSLATSVLVAATAAGVDAVLPSNGLLCSSILLQAAVVGAFFGEAQGRTVEDIQETASNESLADALVVSFVMQDSHSQEDREYEIISQFLCSLLCVV